MPFFIWILLMTVLAVVFSYVYNTKKNRKMQLNKKTILSAAIFLFSSISLFISLGLFKNLFHYVKVTNHSPADILGGDFWLYMNWLQPLLLAIVCFISWLSLFQPKE